MWTPRTLAAAEASQFMRRGKKDGHYPLAPWQTEPGEATTEAETLSASLEPIVLPPGHALSCNPSAGASMPWEGSTGSAGGKLNTGNGNKLTEIPLVSWRDRGGMTIDFTLYHNSQTSYNDELGKGWTWTYDIYIFESMGTAIVHWGDGTSIPFTESASTSLAAASNVARLFALADLATHSFDTEYDAPTGIYDTLVKHGDGTYTVTTKDQTEYHFNDDGFCEEIVDRNGNTITLTLDGDNYVTEVTAPSGRSITIDIDGSNHFTGITDPLEREWLFTVNGMTGRLDEVEWPEVDSVSYSDTFSYNAANRITTHTDKRGKSWTSAYNADGSLASETTPLSHTTSYGYATGATTITLPGSQTIVHNYSSGKLASIVDQASYSESYTYNGSNQVTAKVDRRGKTWSYTLYLPLNRSNRPLDQGGKRIGAWGGSSLYATRSALLGRCVVDEAALPLQGRPLRVRTVTQGPFEPAYKFAGHMGRA